MPTRLSGRVPATLPILTERNEVWDRASRHLSNSPSSASKNLAFLSAPSAWSGVQDPEASQVKTAALEERGVNDSSARGKVGLRFQGNEGSLGKESQTAVRPRRDMGRFHQHELGKVETRKSLLALFWLRLGVLLDSLYDLAFHLVTQVMRPSKESDELPDPAPSSMLQLTLDQLRLIVLHVSYRRLLKPAIQRGD